MRSTPAFLQLFGFGYTKGSTKLCTVRKAAADRSSHSTGGLQAEPQPASHQRWPTQALASLCRARCACCAAVSTALAAAAFAGHTVAAGVAVGQPAPKHNSDCRPCIQGPLPGHAPPLTSSLHENSMGAAHCVAQARLGLQAPNSQAARQRPGVPRQQAARPGSRAAWRPGPRPPSPQNPYTPSSPSRT